MGHAVRVVCRAEVAAGFALAGLTTVEVSDPEEGMRRVRELAATPDVGVVLVQEDVYAGFSEEARRDLGRRLLPMVVAFPEPSWKPGLTAPEVYIVDILRRAIGYSVRLR